MRQNPDKIRVAGRGAAYALLCNLASCAAGPQIRPEPEIRTVTVKVATPVPCPALAQLGAEPSYPDTDAALQAAPDIRTLAKLYAKGRLMRMQRLAEYGAAKVACTFNPN